MLDSRRAVDPYGPEFGRTLTPDLVRRYLTWDDHEPNLRARLGEFFLAALPFALIGHNLRESVCHPGYSAEDCQNCARIVRLREALDMALP